MGAGGTTKAAPSLAMQTLTQMVRLRQSLRARRESAGISQAVLAAGLTVERETVSRRETGNVLDLKLSDLLVWIVRLGGEINVTWRVTPADAAEGTEWGRVAYPDYDLDGEVLPVVSRRYDERFGMDMVVLMHDGQRIALPAHHVMPADAPKAVQDVPPGGLPL